ncbi:MAG TPA: hypothetical protein VFK05_23575 [Polyangiaceae bacterium]|nr:hypothetical protein [Polyangiaceae bacterium]
MTRKLSFWSSLGMCLLWVGSSWAEPSAADRATARSLAGEGYQALQAKDYATAVDRFSRADALVHAPTLMIDWARSLAGLGKLVEAQERYEQIIREGVEPKAPKSWHRALTDAGAELVQLKPRLPWLTISVEGAPDAHVTIDGVTVPQAAIGVRRAVNPGALSVRVVAKGFRSQERTIALMEGAEEAATFRLEPDPDQQEPVAPVQAPPPEPTAVKRHDQTAVYVALGVSAAGLAVGAISGAFALSKGSDLSPICDSELRCQSAQSDTVTAYTRLYRTSNIAFGVAGASAAVALTLWLVNRDTSQPAPAKAVVVRPYLGIGSVGAVGSF